MAIKMKVSIISVTYNSQMEIANMIDSVFRSCKKNSFEIIISDNSPNSETENVIKEFQRKHKNIIYIKNHENLGFSKGNNKGVEKSSGEYVLFLNPDMVLEEDAVDGVVDFLEQTNDAGAATCAVFLPGEKLDDSCHRGFPTPWNSFSYFFGLSKLFPKLKIFAGYNMTYLNFSKTHEIDSLAGSFMMIPRKVGESLNWWDEDYFFYGEDIDFCYRIKKLGYKIYFIPQYRALHYKGVSSGIKKISKDKTTATLETKLWATNQRFKAMEIFYTKHYVKKYPSLITKIVLWGIALKQRKAVYEIKNGK